MSERTGTIYMLINSKSKDPLYIGQTVRPLEQRLHEHKENPGGYMMRAFKISNDVDDLEIVAIDEDIPVSDLDQLEQEWIRYYDPPFNVQHTTRSTRLRGRKKFKSH